MVIPEGAPITLSGHSRQGEHVTRTVSRAGVLVLLAAAFAPSAGATPLRVAPPNGDIGGAGARSTQGTPLPGGEGRGVRAGATRAITTNHPLGPHVVHNL